MFNVAVLGFASDFCFLSFHLQRAPSQLCGLQMQHQLYANPTENQTRSDHQQQIRCFTATRNHSQATILHQRVQACMPSKRNTQSAVET